VWEWCADRHDQAYYAISPATDPAGPSRGRQHRVMRGGSWAHSQLGGERASSRYENTDDSDDDQGFRCAWGADAR
jgi:sulfatase modifying factor 1